MAAYANGGNSNFIFNAAVDLTIFGKRLYLALGFNLKDPVGSLRTGADKSTEWYKDKMNPKNPTDTEKNYYDSPNPFADFEMSGTNSKLIYLNKNTLIQITFRSTKITYSLKKCQLLVLTLEFAFCLEFYFLWVSRNILDRESAIGDR